MSQTWKQEHDVDDFVKQTLSNLGLKKGVDFNEKGAYSPYLKEALQGSSKTAKKTGTGIPDFSIEMYKNTANDPIPILFECKLHTSKLVSIKNDNISLENKAISDFAVNGSVYYAKSAIASGKYKEAIAIGIAGDDESDVKIQVYYVYGSSLFSHKFLEECKTLDFCENKRTFEAFYKSAILTEEDKHRLIIKTQNYLQEHAKKLNKLMHNHNITAPQRVLYVSGMLLSMQDIDDERGLNIEDLKGSQLENKRDGKLIVNQIEEFLKHKINDVTKRNLMLSSFSEISKDLDRDKIQTISTASDSQVSNDKLVADLLPVQSSTNKQIFAYIYHYIFTQIKIEGHADIMGQMYSEFLKYALGDGKELGIVLTPPYVTKMMAQILDIDEECKVMDLATGSAGFLISAMEIMIDKVKHKFSKDSTRANEKIKTIKQTQLLGVEYNAEMFALATTNMILRGDGSSKIQKANTFDTPQSLYEDFKATRILLNPPFTWAENGMPFIEFGLRNMQKGGLGAIIIQDSAGSGKAIKSNTKILKNHTLKASVKMPIDLFEPMASVQTSIYIFEAKIPHDFEKPVKFIDFRNDGFKRTKRSLQEVSSPELRYKEIINIYKAGKNAKVSKDLWNLDEIYIEDFIGSSGCDWNFDQHKKIDSKPSLEDFKKSVSDFLAWEVSQILKNQSKEQTPNFL